MTGERFLLDTVFIQALLNKRDSYHRQASAFLPRVRSAAEVWITEAVLVEVGALHPGRLYGVVDIVGKGRRYANRNPRPS